MSRRTHDARFPKWSPKSIFGSMPHWLKRYHHHKQRQIDRRWLYWGEEPPTLRHDDSWM